MGVDQRSEESEDLLSAALEPVRSTVTVFKRFWIVQHDPEGVVFLPREHSVPLGVSLRLAAKTAVSAVVGHRRNLSLGGCPQWSPRRERNTTV